MPDTFFIVEIEINKETIVFGPYADMSAAAKILVDFAPMYAERLVRINKYKYSATLSECYLDEENKWKKIFTHVKENECYKRKLIS